MRMSLHMRWGLQMRWTLSVCLAAGLMGLACGCGAIAAISYKVTGEGPNPAEFKPAKRPTLILAENFANSDQYRVASAQLERIIGNELIEHKVTQIVSSEKLEDLRTSDAAAFRRMNIGEVGRAVGAKQVIYVNLVKFSAESPIGGEELAGKAEARVRVIDVETGRTLWPPDTSDGREVRYETKHEEDVDFANRADVQDQISQSLGEKIARLFYSAPEPENDVAPKS